MVFLRDIPKFPYEIHPWQEGILGRLSGSTKHSMVLEAPTGSGKTVAVLYHVASSYPDKKIVFLTRTNSQMENILKEARNLGLKKVMSFLGRGEMCLYRNRESEMKSGDPEEQSQYCRALVKRAKSGLSSGCPYNTEFNHTWGESVMDQEAFIRLGDEQFCPYFAQKDLIRDADIIVTTYSFFLNPFIRERFISWMEAEMNEIVIVADEAHNIPELTRNMSNLKITYNMLAACRNEISQYGDIPFGNYYASFVIDSLEEALDRLLEEGNRVITPLEVSEAYMESFQVNSVDIRNLLMFMANYGLSIKESKENEGKLPRSQIYNTSVLALKLMDEEEDYRVIISHTEEPSGISVMYLETYDRLRFFNETFRSIFMSGTISPFEKFRDEMGLEDFEKIIIKTDYLERNLKVLYVNDVSSRYSSKLENEGRMVKYIQDIVEKIKRNKIVFCTSYEQLTYFLEQEIKGRIYFERRGMSNEEFGDLLTKFRDRGGSLFAVINGRISEGIDLPGNLLEVAVLAGIPYPPPSPETSSMELFYEMKFKRGWEYAYEASAATRIRQAIGRVIRSPEDRGVAIILDSRARKFKSYLPNLYLSNDVISDTLAFMDQ
jgi:DNA excision repair protein ERCC-2